MDLDEYLKQSKEQIKNTEIVKHEKKDKRKEAYEEANDYYTIPCTKEGYEGDVIELNGEEFNVYYQKYGAGRTEAQFRDKLDRCDYWLHDKPYRVQQNWMGYVPKWMMKGN
jgi:hypothetical protein